MYHRNTDPPSDSTISISIGSSKYSSSAHSSMASRQWKQFQRQFYSFVFSTTGKSIILVGIIFAFYFILGIVAMWSSYMTGENAITTSMSAISSMSPFCTHGCAQHDYADNIKGINMEGLLCHEPMDIVYTWVNGNDEQLQDEIDTFKRRHEIQEHLAKDPNWTQPIGIQFSIVLNGGIVTKWKNDYFDYIKQEMEHQLERIVRDHQQLMVHRPNRTNTRSNSSLNVDVDSNHNDSVADVLSNIEALDRMNDDDRNSSQKDIHREGRRMLLDDGDDANYTPRSLRNKDRKNGKMKAKKSEKQNTEETTMTEMKSEKQKTKKKKSTMTMSIDEINEEFDGNDNDEVDHVLEVLDNLLAQKEESDALRDEEEEFRGDDVDDEENLGVGLDDDLEEYIDDDEYFVDDNDVDDDEDDGTVTSKNATANATNSTGAVTEQSFIFIKYWTKIKLRSVADFDESNAFCYSQEELQQLVRERQHSVNSTDNHSNSTVPNKEETPKLLLLEDDTAVNDTENVRIISNSTVNATSSVQSTNSSSTEETDDILMRSYCIELKIEMVHSDQFGAVNQTLPFMELLIDNITYWNNFTQNVNRRLSSLSYNEANSYSSYSSDSEPIPRAIDQLFEFKKFAMINQSADISVVNVSEVTTGGKGRYRDNEELRYSLRSVWQFAPWIRNIYIVTNGQVPSWLNLDSEKIWVVTHEEIFKNVSFLPTFASPSIEANIHRIPGLSSRFLYLNDDVMFGNDVYPDDFWKLDGTQFFFPSWEPPKCSDGCPNNWLHDGYCDSACNTEDCGWDGGDCLDEHGENTGPTHSSSGGSGDKGGEDRYCTSGCPMTWVGDKVCDRACQDVDCAFDGGDCGLEMMTENKMFGVALDPNTGNGSVIELTEDVMTFYVDFSMIFEKEQDVDNTTTTAPKESENAEGPSQPPTSSPTKHPEENMIKTAQLDHKDMVRTAIITQSERLLAVILQPHSRIDDEEEVVFDIGGITNGEEVHWVFTVHRDAPKKKLNKHAVQKKIDWILQGLNVSDIHSLEIKEGSDDPKAERQLFEWNNVSVMSIEALWKRLEDETEKEEEKQEELKGVLYRELFTFAGNNTVWMIESDDRITAILRDGYDEWTVKEAERKRKEANATHHDEESKPKPPTLPPYLWDDDIMYKYEDDFFLDEGAEYGMDMDYYYDYDEAFDDGFYDRRRRNLLTIDGLKPLLFDSDGNARLDSGDRIKMLRERQYTQDDDYKMMIDLGLIDEDGRWLPSKAEKDWVFLADFRQQILTENANDDDFAMEMPVVDGYINAEDTLLIRNDMDQNSKLSKIKQRSKEKIYEGDVMRIRRKLDDIFEHNSMTAFPWMMKDLSLYVFHAEYASMQQQTASPNRRTLLDTFGDSLRFVSRILNENFGAETRYVPAHMPHAIDREILIELVDRFPDEYAATSSHRFRSRHDMQWSFSYFYYMMSAKYNFSDIDYIYKEWLDRDRDGVLNDYELETMINEVLVKEATKDTANAELGSANATIWKDFFHKALWNITRQLHDLTYWHPLQITVYSINYTTVARDYLLSHFNDRKKFRFEKKNLDDVEFYMIKDRPRDVKERLDHMYGKKPKFMCLNDDLPHDRDPSNETLSTMKSFFKKYYPYPSPFEIEDPARYHPYIRKGDMVRNGYWKHDEWSLSNNKHYRPYNERVEVKRAKKKNMYKRRRLQMYGEYWKGIGNNVKSMYNSLRRRKSQNQSNVGNGNYSYHIANDMPLPGEANNRKEQIRYWLYVSVIRRFRGYNWFIQFVSLFAFCSVVVTAVLQIGEMIRYWLSVSVMWIFTNNPTLFDCCSWFSFNTWFGRKETKHSD